MATRREVEQRRRRLEEALRRSLEAGNLAAGDLLPPVNQYAQEYELSATVVRQVLYSLRQEGLLYTLPRIGTFAGRADTHRPRTEFSRPSYLSERITVDPALCNGIPTVRGLPYTAEMILERLSTGVNYTELLAEQPGLQREDILAVLAYAAHRLS